MSDPEKLIFSQPPLEGLPARLVFGGEDDDGPGPGTPNVTISGGGTITGIRFAAAVRLVVRASGAATITGMRFRAAVHYDINVSRPTVGQAAGHWQDAVSLQTGMAASYQQAQPLTSGPRGHWQDARGIAAALRAHWEQCERLVSLLGARYQQAQRLPVLPLAQRYQEAERLRAGAAASFQQAVRLPVPVLVQRYQEAIRLRGAASAGYQEAVHVTQGVRDGMGIALQVFNSWRGRYQEAWPPRPGRWSGLLPPQPQPDPCYLPQLPVRLVFEEEGTDGVLPPLVFVCERHGPGPEPGETIVVPVRRVYVVINEARLRRVDGDIQIPTFTMSMSLDADSWTWSFSASVPGYALADIEPEDGVPVAVQATINGVPYRFVVESIARERTFGRSDLRIGGRGRAAVLDAPYAPIMSFGNEFGRTAQQIMIDILTDNGVPLGWDVEWNPDDWNVPAGVFNHQGSYISALNQVAGSISAYLQPHNTDEVLRVLSRYPVAPWDWAGVTPDFDLPAAVMSRESIEWRDKPRYNRVYVMGQQAGVNGRVTRAGTAGDYLAPSVVDPLITQAVAARQRGISVLSDTGRIATVGLRLPVLAETGIIKPGNFVRYTDGGTERIGITRSVQVEVGLPSIWQTIGVETHVEPV